MSSLTNADIDSFDQHGEAFWDLSGPYKTLHQINPARLKFIRRFIDPTDQKILDIGCGGGILSEALAKEGAKVYGIDLSKSVIHAAKAHAQESALNIHYRQISSRDCVAENEQYDQIVCMEMLEHVPDPSQVIHDIYALLKPGGYAFFSTLNRNPISFFTAIVAAEWITRLVPRGTHQHSWFIRPNELVNTIEHAGLEAVALSGMDYHPLLGTALLSRNLNTHYLLAARRPVAS